MLAVVLTGCGGTTTATLATGDEEPSSGTAPSCDEVETFADAGSEHVADGTVVESYNSDPPTSGPHYALPSDPGFFDSPLPREQLVHNLEHGQIVIYYSSTAPPDLIASLQELVQSEAVALVVVPNEAASESNEIVLTAWTHLQRCSGFSGTDIEEFRAAWQGRGPENVGVPPFEGGDAA